MHAAQEAKNSTDGKKVRNIPCTPQYDRHTNQREKEERRPLVLPRTVNKRNLTQGTRARCFKPHQTLQGGMEAKIWWLRP